MHDLLTIVLMNDAEYERHVMSQTKNSDPQPLPNKEAQAPRQISVESVDKNSRPAPAHPEDVKPHGPQGRCRASL